MAVSYILIRPPQLPELGDPSDAFIVGYDPSTDRTVKIKVANIGGGSVSPPLDISWKSNIEYSSGEIVEYNLRLWKSLQGSNEGNFPTEGIWWTEVARGNQSITYWTAGVYTKDPTIKLVNDIFYRLDAALPFESVDFANELANGDWVAIGGGGGGLRIVNIEEGSNIILDADSGNTYYRYKGASPITVTVPNTVPLALPFAINQMGVGDITIQGGAGVVLTTANLKTGGQGFGVTIMKVANNLVDVIGGVE